MQKTDIFHCTKQDSIDSNYNITLSSVLPFILYMEVLINSFMTKVSII